MGPEIGDAIGREQDGLRRDDAELFANGDDLRERQTQAIVRTGLALCWGVAGHVSGRLEDDPVALLERRPGSRQARNRAALDQLRRLGLHNLGWAMLLPSGELNMMLFGSALVGPACVYCRSIRAADGLRAPVDSDPGCPALPLLIPVDAFVPALAAGRDAPVQHVLRGRRGPNVDQPVIVPDAINVVDLVLRPCPIHVEKREPMQEDITTEQVSGEIAFARWAAQRLACRLVREDPCRGIVMDTPKHLRMGHGIPYGRIRHVLSDGLPVPA
jgi:hypothetical protein